MAIKMETRRRPTFSIKNSNVESVEISKEPFCDLPPYLSLLLFNEHCNFSPAFILGTLSVAFQQADFSIDQPPKVLSLGTGGNAYEEFNVMLYLTNGNLQKYSGIEIDPYRAYLDAQSLKGIPSANGVLGNVTELEKIVSGQWDIALIRNPEISAGGKHYSTWGMATAKLKRYLSEDFLLVMTTMSESEMRDTFGILRRNDYRDIKVTRNPTPGPLVGIHKTNGERYCSDQCIITARI
jgi:hypothetical protein